MTGINERSIRTWLVFLTKRKCPRLDRRHLLFTTGSQETIRRKRPDHVVWQTQLRQCRVHLKDHQPSARWPTIPFQPRSGYKREGADSVCENVHSLTGPSYFFLVPSMYSSFPPFQFLCTIQKSTVYTSVERFRAIAPGQPPHLLLES